MPRAKASTSASSAVGAGPQPALKKQTLQVGNKKRKCGSQLRAMPDSSEEYRQGKFALLRRRLAEQGYIFVRGVIPRKQALTARRCMLQQAYADGNIAGNAAQLDDAVVRRVGAKKVPAAGYCVDGITGSETNERPGIDVQRWEEIGPSVTMQAVYNGEALHQFLRNIFGDAVRPLPKQTFLRLMGDGGTQEHADYYYFKRDTHIFSGSDGQAAMRVSKEYLQSQGLYDEDRYENVPDFAEPDPSSEHAVDEDALRCNICERAFSEESVGRARLARLDRADFGVEGEWHCPPCARRPFAIYTVWISLSHLELARRDSILAVCPESQLLREWDLPRRGQQLPGDFRWAAPWVAPAEVQPGDVVLFNIKTVHAATRNQCRPLKYRASCDTRLQLVPQGWENNEDERSDDEELRVAVKEKAEEKSPSGSDDPDDVMREARPVRRSRRLREKRKRRRSSYHTLQVVLSDGEAGSDSDGDTASVTNGIRNISIN